MEMMSERLYWQPLSRTTQKSTVKHSPEYGELTQLAIWAKKLKGIPMSMWIKKTALLQSKLYPWSTTRLGVGMRARWIGISDDTPKNA